jgi:hypothetical protein
VVALLVGIPVTQSIHDSLSGAPEADPTPPTATSTPREAASVVLANAVLRVQHSDGFTGAEDFTAVAQVQTTESGWKDVLHGNVALPARLDPSGHWLALMVERASLTEPQVRTWLYVVRVRDGAVFAGRQVERSTAVVGWTGHKVVAQQEDGVRLLLADRGRGKVTRIQPTG